MKTLKRPLFVTALLLTTSLAPVAWAAPDTPVGTWKTIDDATGKAKSLITITEQDGKLQGTVVKLINPSKPNPVCEKCEGQRKNQPILGMQVLWDVRKDGDQWDGGQVLDPEKGKIYGVKLTMADNGRKLDVRGFIGFSLLGRTQTWLREPDADAATPPTAP
ncbi:DUF2147 domain-containing protein [Solimonas terrae]|uniref:DUF2147 domain-containing protein n=1 Tax=Solimonas terrae TaxID=1396819 RepID=A0A6M2BVW0_9GAMM|nr:DUF2147 domain-containing protein [Solimonas terrae]NGY06395.1 DUF2147 domain-containing protein [Solimonas terrae]